MSVRALVNRWLFNNLPSDEFIFFGHYVDPVTDLPYSGTVDLVPRRRASDGVRTLVQRRMRVPIDSEGRVAGHLVRCSAGYDVYDSVQSPSHYAKSHRYAPDGPGPLDLNSLPVTIP